MSINPTTEPDEPTIIANHPPGIWVGDGILRCPACGHEDDVQGYDVMGADPDCLFCIQCSQEIQL
jgi:hypothetical protein